MSISSSVWEGSVCRTQGDWEQLNVHGRGPVGRWTWFLFGFHWHRPIQARANSPMVCSGCCFVFRRDDLMAFGGFPERTIVEDMDFTCYASVNDLMFKPDRAANMQVRVAFWILLTCAGVVECNLLWQGSC
ncbi:hypothetical protein ACFWIY_26020 [Streptomyces sioyaensis]|uniref:hypothetical protein n=1 Tax=Streptomyces sioyaensis TaxID=67364 RepID=UPI0036608B67